MQFHMSACFHILDKSAICIKARKMKGGKYLMCSFLSALPTLLSMDYDDLFINIGTKCVWKLLCHGQSCGGKDAIN